MVIMLVIKESGDSDFPAITVFCKSCDFLEWFSFLKLIQKN